MFSQRDGTKYRLSPHRSRILSVQTGCSVALIGLGLAGSACDGKLHMGAISPDESDGGMGNGGRSGSIAEQGGGGAGQVLETTSHGGASGDTSSVVGTLSSQSVGGSHSGGASLGMTGGQASSSAGGTPTNHTASAGGTAGAGLSGAPSAGTSGTTETGRKGMTWGKLARFFVSKLEWLGCNGEPLLDGVNYCNAVTGDTFCSAARPILCLDYTSLARPAYTVSQSRGVLNDEYYSGWTGGKVATTPAVAGTKLTSRARADEICRETFGSAWRMAEFHDGRWILGMSAGAYHGDTWDFSASNPGGWSFYALTDTPMPETTRYWVAINDQSANCWDGP